AAGLQQRGWPVLLLDHPGSDERAVRELLEGRRPPPGAETLSDRVLDLQAVVRAVEQGSLPRLGDQVVLMGHSLGASVVLHAADHLQQQAPDSLKALVLIAAGGGIYQPRPFQRLRQGGRLVVLMRPALPLPLGPFQAERRAALGLLVNSTCRGSIRAIPELVSRLEVENLWISGSQDRVMEPGYVRHLAGYSPQHALVSLPDCGHLPMQSHPEALASALRGWLQSLARPRSCNSASSA
ncbi:MAG: alpha/beta fold hydrolase, partial [Synechococcaceae bacterium WB9_4xB_025]|nr:alpha/beta fold hydrolase [Synechococcaceae bacterium WB9_4xB_025]